MHKEDVFFQQNLLEKAYFIAKMSGPAGQFWLLESALRFQPKILPKFSF